MSLLETLESQAATAERAGDWEAAASAYRAIFRETWQLRRVDLIADCLRRAARVSHLRSHTDEAEDLALLSLEIADRNDLVVAGARALNLLGLLEHARGRFPEAGELYTAALERARTAGDAELIGATCQNLGVLANMRGDLEEARARYFECMGSVLRTGNRNAAMGLYNNLGMVCSDLEDWLEAEIYFGRGIEIAEQLDDRVMLGRLWGNYAEPLIHSGEFSEALAALARAEELTPEEDQRGLSEFARFRGVIGLKNGDLATAESQLERALHLAEEAELRLERAESLEQIAVLRHLQGRIGAARVMAGEALRIYTAIGAERDADRLRRRIATWTAPPPAISASD